MKIRHFVFLALIAVFGVQCKDKATGLGPTNISTQDSQVFIRDDTGRDWDVTHAKEKYGMKPELFQYGLGVGAIPAINDPVFLSPGEAGYPGNNESFMVLGVEIDGDARAYRMTTLARHEVVNDWFGELPVAVTN